MVLIKVTLNTINFPIYIGSWHGPHKISTDNKKEVAQKINEIVTSKVGPLPYLIGGDFNLPRNDFPNVDNSYPAAASPDDIDYFVFGGSGDIMEGVKKSPYENSGIAKAFLDHVPVVGRLRILQPRMKFMLERYQNH